MFDRIVHKWLRVPYILHVRRKRLAKHASQTYLFLHGIGDTGDVWNHLIDSLPDSVNYVTIDLLGFGKSPSPRWSKYDAKIHARSVLATFLRLGITTPVTVIGHSLGGLIAIEFAKSYPLLTKELLLCSPPIYENPTLVSGKKHYGKQRLLHTFYRQIAKDPGVIVNGYALGKKLGVFNQSLDVKNDNVDLFIQSLEQSIVNQETIDHIRRIKQPVTIISGTFDPLVVLSTLIKVARSRPNIHLVTIPSGHIIRGNYVATIVKLLKKNASE